MRLLASVCIRTRPAAETRGVKEGEGGEGGAEAEDPTASCQYASAPEVLQRGGEEDVESQLTPR